MNQYRKIAGLILLAGFAIMAIADTISRRLGEVDFKTAREADENNAPTWPVDLAFKKDTFTFARIKYTVDGTHGFGHTPHRWAIDFPASELPTNKAEICDGTGSVPVHWATSCPLRYKVVSLGL